MEEYNVNLHATIKANTPEEADSLARGIAEIANQSRLKAYGVLVTVTDVSLIEDAVTEPSTPPEVPVVPVVPEPSKKGVFGR